MTVGVRLASLAVALFGLVFATLAPAPALAAADPAAAQIETFNNSLLEAMKSGKSLGLQGRYRKLQPAIERTFDIPTMIRFAVGPGWPQIPAAQQQALTNSFLRLTIASYAKNFDSYSGQRFVVSPNVLTRGP